MGKRKVTRQDAASGQDDRSVGASHEFRRKPASLPLPGRRLGAMDRQSGLALQSSQCFPQQFVRLVGHRHEHQAIGAGPKAAQMGSLEPEAPIG